jgi:hypothetical protein
MPQRVPRNPPRAAKGKVFGASRPEVTEDDQYLTGSLNPPGDAFKEGRDNVPCRIIPIHQRPQAKRAGLPYNFFSIRAHASVTAYPSQFKHHSEEKNLVPQAIRFVRLRS